MLKKKIGLQQLPKYIYIICYLNIYICFKYLLIKLIPMKKITTLLTCMLFACSVSFGQYYYVTGGTGNPGNLNTDNEFSNTWSADGWTSILGPSVTTPTWSAVQTIPFPFNFNGNPVTQYKMSSTGVLTFTTAAAAVPGPINVALPSGAIPDASICMWGIQASGANDQVVIKEFGTAPNRQQWIYLVSNTLGGAGWTYMSIVLEETSDRIYIVEQRNTGNTGTITAGIQINGTTAVSVAGSPTYTPLVGNFSDATDNIYYEFIQGVQPAVDMELTSIANLPYAAAGNLNITGVLTNLGANAVTSLTINYNDGSGAVADNITGLNILSGATYNFSHATPLAVVGGTNYALTVDVTIGSDANLANNDGTITIAGLTSVPAKVVVGEENTGTWCQYCPAGAVGLANMESESDFIGIAVHDNDPMEVSAYNTASSTLFPDFTGYPNGSVDRVTGNYPSASAFLAGHNARKTAIVPCSVNSVTAEYNSVTGMISVSTVAEFFGNITGNYRLSCIIVQDNMSSTASSGWNQVNAYSGGGSGLAFPAGINNGYNFDTGSNPALPAAFGGYDHTARSLSSNDIFGDSGSLPANPTIGTYNHTFADVDITTMPGASDVAFDRENAHAVVMVIAANGQILNAAKATIDIPVSVQNVNVTKFNLKAFPNPTNQVSTISFSLAESATVSMEVFNNVGSLVFAENAKNMTAGTQKITFDGTDLSGGIYFVNLKVGEQIITKKISLIK